MVRSQPSVQEGKGRQQQSLHVVSIMTFTAFSMIIVPVRQAQKPQLLSHRICKPLCGAVENSTDKHPGKKLSINISTHDRKELYTDAKKVLQTQPLNFMTHYPTSLFQTKYTGKCSTSLLHCCITAAVDGEGARL